MGMFDSVYIDCPECGEEVEFQSKAGDCVLASYSKGDAIPMTIVADLSGELSSCHAEGCDGVAEFPVTQTTYRL